MTDAELRTPPTEAEVASIVADCLRENPAAYANASPKSLLGIARRLACERDVLRGLLREARDVVYRRVNTLKITDGEAPPELRELLARIDAALEGRS